MARLADPTTFVWNSVGASRPFAGQRFAPRVRVRGRHAWVASSGYLRTPTTVIERRTLVAKPAQEGSLFRRDSPSAAGTGVLLL